MEGFCALAASPQLRRLHCGSCPAFRWRSSAIGGACSSRSLAHFVRNTGCGDGDRGSWSMSRLTLRWSRGVKDEVPSSVADARTAQLNR